VRQSFDGLLAPMIARTLSESSAAETGLATASATRLILAIQLPMLVLLAVIGRPLLGWFGPEFVAGYYAMIMLAAAETIQGAFGVSDLILLYRRPALVLAVTCTSAAVNFVAGFLLVRTFGIDGAALAMLLAWVAGAMVRRWSLGRVLGSATPLAHSGGPMAAALIAAVLAGAAFYWSPGGESTRYVAATVVVLAAYALGLWLWIRVSGESLRLVNFRT
jgi:O-antigen/teichoic acid export membrane protein